MIGTIVHAARTLNIVVEIDGKPVFGGHSLRRGGAQYLARSGVDIWRIQALARHSSSAILLYLDGIHAESLGNMAAEASLGRSLQSVREELEGLRAQLAKHKLDLDSTLTSTLPISSSRFEVPLLASDVAPPEEDPGVPSTSQIACINAHPFVLSARRTGRCHRRDPSIPDRAICGWPWARFPGAILSSVITGMGCTKCASRTQRDATASRDTASSESSSSAALSHVDSSGE
jgi:hypothetical protein